MYVLATAGTLTSLYYLLPYYLDPYDCRFPDPLLAAFSNLWLARAAQATKRQTAVDEMHQKYGAFVRIAPNHISIADPEAFELSMGTRVDYSKQISTTSSLLMNRICSAPRIEQPMPDHKCNAAAWGASSENWTTVDGRAVFECTEQFAYLGFDAIGDLTLGSTFGAVSSQRDNMPLNNPTNNRIINITIVQVTLAVSEVGTTIATRPTWFRPLVRLLPWNYHRSKEIFDFAHLTIAKVDDKLERAGKLKDENGASLSRKELLSEAFLFLFAGSDTTSSTLGTFCYLMATHPEVQRKLQVELDEHIPLELEFNQDGSIDTTSDVVANYEHVKNLLYLNACVKEVMRFQSVTGMGLPRVVPSGQTFTFKGQVFKEGSIISVPGFTVFRACIGRNLAIMQVLLVTATLFRRYDVVLAPSQSGNEVEIREAIHRKVENCHVAIKIRKIRD